MSRPDIREFIEDCRLVLADRGECNDFGIIMGHIALRDVTCYDDGCVEIRGANFEGKDLFEVVVHYTIDGKPVENPCIMMRDGETIRHHGDWARAKEHISLIARSVRSSRENVAA